MRERKRFGAVVGGALLTASVLLGFTGPSGEGDSDGDSYQPSYRSTSTAAWLS